MVLFAVLLFAAGVPVPVFAAEAVPLPGVPELLAGVAAGVEDGGNEVSGVGSGGSGLDRMLATISFIPASDLCKYLYQVVRLSCHSGFLAEYAESLPAAAKARA